MKIQKVEKVMNILVIGNGGREHSLIWAIAQNPRCNKLFCIPGNPGIEKLAKCPKIKSDDEVGVINFCLNKKIDLVVIGPEGPLVAGLGDSLRKKNILTFGPSRIASMLEASMSFTKTICRKAKIPTAQSETFKEKSKARAYIEENNVPIVIKADGLAAGKGVIIAHTKHEALKAVNDIFNGKFGAAGKSIVIEEFLKGEEASYFVLTDGEAILPLSSAQDHKRAYDGDTGPNTGGMGAFSPNPIFTPQVEKIVLNKIIKPTLVTMAEQGTPFSGILYAGLMIKDGDPKLIEYNVRFGDPECQTIMVRIGAQILDIILDCIEGNLLNSKINWSDDHAITIVMATKGYPNRYETGSEIKNIERVSRESDVEVFQAGTALKNKKLISNGGRVLNITARANSLQEAKTKAYKAVALVEWDEGFYRNDIGWRAL